MRRFAANGLKLAISLSVIYGFLTCDLVFAKNVSVTNCLFASQSTPNKTRVVQFDISWENSWRNAINYDAAWVFVKYSTDLGLTWSHATLKTTGINPYDTNQGSGTGIDVIVPADKKGAFIRRSANGAGRLSSTSVQLNWDYGIDNVTDAQARNLAKRLIRIMALEMVYIPTEAYELGDGSDTSRAFHLSANSKIEVGPTLVPCIKVAVNDYDDNQIELRGIGIDGNGGIDIDNNGTIDNALFPTGYPAFYIMKYEISQGQYRDFLNMLNTQTQQNTRTAVDLSGENSANTYVMVAEGRGTVASRHRQTIKAGANPSDGGKYAFFCDLNDNDRGDEFGDGEWIACNYLSWADVVAFADWAALRPFTELEYEKACRGRTAAVTKELAWGSTFIAPAKDISNPGTIEEAVSNSEANCVYGSHPLVQGPLRCGFAETSYTTKVQAGASYYGVKELSGNLWERVVTIGTSAGRNFTGLHGDGSLDANGNANVPTWPSLDATGAGFRGGSWYFGAMLAGVSHRRDAACWDPSRDDDYGGRCARNSP